MGLLGYYTFSYKCVLVESQVAQSQYFLLTSEQSCNLCDFPVYKPGLFRRGIEPKITKNYSKLNFNKNCLEYLNSDPVVVLLHSVWCCISIEFSSTV